MADERIDYSSFTGSRSEIGGRAESEGVSHQLQPQRETRSRRDIEAHPDYTQRKAEREGRSNWSGGWAGGGTWAGRSRGD